MISPPSVQGGAEVHGVAADASGPLSFMDVWDAMCRTIMSAGSRRGAIDGDAALRPPRYRGLHRGQIRPRAAAHVQCLGAGHGCLHGGGRGGRAVGPDLSAVASTTPCSARDLWNRIMRATYDYAEPGVIFIDRINAEKQPELRRGRSPRPNPLRRAAAAALWRLPAGVGQPCPAGRRAFHRGRADRRGQTGRSVVALFGADDGQMSSMPRASRSRRRRRRRRRSAGSGWG